MSVGVQVFVLPHGEGLPLPAYQTAGSAGCDVYAAIHEPMTVASGASALVPAGFKMALPEGWDVQVRPRSGLAVRCGITVLNTPGTIDSDYRGEVRVVLINHGPDEFTIQRGERIAQLVLAPVHQISWEPATELGQTARGTSGFGSTGA